MKEPWIEGSIVLQNVFCCCMDFRMKMDLKNFIFILRQSND